MLNCFVRKKKEKERGKERKREEKRERERNREKSRNKEGKSDVEIESRIGRIDSDQARESVWREKQGERDESHLECAQRHGL